MKIKVKKNPTEYVSYSQLKYGDVFGTSIGLDNTIKYFIKIEQFVPSNGLWYNCINLTDGKYYYILPNLIIYKPNKCYAIIK